MRTRSQSRSLANLSRGSGSGSSSSSDADSSSGARSEGMTTRAMRRSLASLSAGSGSSSDAGYSAGAESEGMMTRSSHRRLCFPNLLVPCAESEAVAMRGGWTPSYPAESRRPRKRRKVCLSGAATEAATESEWRDWANLPSEIVEDIAGRLLSTDVSEYLRLRSVCKPWRQCTDDPCSCGGGLDPRFRPRNWIAVPHCASPSRRRLINVSTGARAEVDHPELSTHDCFGVAEGLLILCDKFTSTVRLLNPLTGTLTSFPTITNVRATCVLPSAPLHVFKAFYSSEPRTEEDTRIVMEALKVDVPDPSAINGAGFDDSTSPPTLVLGLRYKLFRIVCAKPGDQHWVSVHHGEQDMPSYSCYGRIYFHSLLSFGGRCYIATPRGDVMTLDLCPPMVDGPRLVYLSKETTLSGETSAYSYLVRSHDQRMLMVRFLATVNLAHDHYEPTEIFMSREGIPSRMELFEVDFMGRRLIPLSSIGGNYAAFVGATYTVVFAADKFPRLAADAVYLHYVLQRWRRLGIYHFKDRKISPPRDLRPDAHGRFFPCACHWDLDDYLICDVEQGHDLSNAFNM